MFFEWIPRSDWRRYRDEMDNIVKTYSADLQCGIGADYYWRGLQNDASKRQPISFIVLMRLESNVVGFCVIRKGKVCTNQNSVVTCEYPDDAWYIEIICTKKGQGLGKSFMTEIHTKAMESGITIITLSALPQVIMFYHGLGYKLTMNLDCMESKQIQSIAAALKNDIAARKASGQMIPTDIDDMLKDERFSELIVTSIREQLAFRQLNGDVTLRECETDVKDCVEDGFYMILCLPKQEMELTSDQVSIRNAFRTFPNVPESSFEDDPVMQEILRTKKSRY